MDTCRKIEVIETTLTRRGKGSGNDPVRVITQYWSLDGKLLAEVDPINQAVQPETMPAVDEYTWTRGRPHPADPHPETFMRDRKAQQ